MCKDIKGEYSNVSMTGSEIIMYEGSRYCVITKTGVERINKDLGRIFYRSFRQMELINTG